LVRKRSKIATSIAALDLPSHASEIFGRPPPLSRHTTYSSLPPSPRLGLDDYGSRIKELKDTLTHIDDVIGDNEEVFWPARSRRGTIDESQRPQLEEERDLGLPPVAPRSSLWDLLTDEAGEGWDGWAVDGKWERIQEFMAVPMAVEKVSN
jgi:hypothetical protein